MATRNLFEGGNLDGDDDDRPDGGSGVGGGGGPDSTVQRYAGGSSGGSFSQTSSSPGEYNPIGNNPGSTGPAPGAGTSTPAGGGGTGTPAGGTGAPAGGGTGAGGSQGNNQTYGTVTEGPEYGVATKVTAGRQGAMDGSWIPAQNEAQNESPYTSGLWDLQAPSPTPASSNSGPQPGSAFQTRGTTLISGPGPNGFLGGVVGSYFK